MNWQRSHRNQFVCEKEFDCSIPGTGFSDWPITYADLEAYYTKAEYELGGLRLGWGQPL
jgi:choline dehydrogenase-like flavoprotein